MRKVKVHVPFEIRFCAARKYHDIDKEVELEVVFSGPGGNCWRMPAFWNGGNEFCVRFAAPLVGSYEYCSVCNQTADEGLHNRRGSFRAEIYQGANPLYIHGRLRVAANRRYLEHEDGTPFFWLGDTWWMGLCKRLRWPADFKRLAADRQRKGFTVVQIVAGLYPDMAAFDPRGANEAGFPWEKDYRRLRPSYFINADRRIAHLVACGMVPCLVGCWGYYLGWLGLERMKRHWRNLVARYAAYPVVWCLAGEGAMPYYLSSRKEEDAAQQKRGWTEIAQYVRSLDPFRNPVTIHPTDRGRDQIDEPSLLDFEMLQTGHSDRLSLPNHANAVAFSFSRQPIMPVLVAETCYEGIGESCRQEVQRMAFWMAWHSGACGYTYGANGIWQVNTKRRPYGPSPHGMAWGNTPWEEAMRLPGSTQLGMAKRLLERYPWWQCEPHAEWIEPAWSKDNCFAPYAAGIPKKLRLFYFPVFPWQKVVIKHLEPDIKYRAFLWNPVNGQRHALAYQPQPDGTWVVQDPASSPTRFAFPLYQDWLLVMEAKP